MRVLGRTEVLSIPCKSRVAPKPTAKTMRIISTFEGVMRLSPSWMPCPTRDQISPSSVVRAPQTSAKNGSDRKNTMSVPKTGISACCASSRLALDRVP